MKRKGLHAKPFCVLEIECHYLSVSPLPYHSLFSFTTPDTFTVRKDEIVKGLEHTTAGRVIEGEEIESGIVSEEGPHTSIVLPRPTMGSVR